MRPAGWHSDKRSRSASGGLALPRTRVERAGRTGHKDALRAHVASSEAAARRRKLASSSGEGGDYNANDNGGSDGGYVVVCRRERRLTSNIRPSDVFFVTVFANFFANVEFFVNKRDHNLKKTRGNTMTGR